MTGGDKALQGVTKDYRNFFLTRTFLDTFSWSIMHKNHCWSWSWFLKAMFLFFRKACLLYKTSKIVFWWFIFTICDMGIQGVIRGYRGLQWVTRCYKRLQKVTTGYKGLPGVQGVTRGDRGWQGVTGGYKGLQKINFNENVCRYFFLVYFAWKSKLKKSRIFDQNNGLKPWKNPFGKILIGCFSYTVVFILFKGFFFI